MKVHPSQSKPAADVEGLFSGLVSRWARLLPFAPFSGRRGILRLSAGARMANFPACCAVFSLGLMPVSAAKPIDEDLTKKSWSEDDLLAAAYQVDLRVAKAYQKKGVAAPGQVTDAVFLRRSFLVAVGRIPTVEESRVFLESDDVNRRVLLLRYLMKSEGYRSHMGNWLVDLLRVRDSFQNNKSADPYMQWVRRSIENNRPFHEIAYDLLSAQGAVWQNGAVGYYIRDKGMPLDNMSNTMRLFLGTRMECAQCHDHPYEDWERMDFYQLAAFTHGQGEINRGVWNAVWQQIREAKQERTELGVLMRFLGDEVYYGSLTGGGSGRIKLPGDYQYNDGDPNDWVNAHTPYDKSFGKGVRMSKRRDGDDGMSRFARWATEPNNERFATTITNRMWNRVMGRGLFEPIDEYQPAEETVSPELTRYLVDLMQELNFDLNAFQHVLMLTRVYAFKTTDQRGREFEKPLPGLRGLSRMTAEQYWDSLVTLIAGNPDALAKRQSSDVIFYRSKPVLLGEMTMSQLQQEVLAIDSPSELKKYAQALLKRIEDRGSSPHDGMPSMVRKISRKRGAVQGIARASELSSPAPKGHVLEIFGQSERILLGAASKEANATQVLSMLNGEVEKWVVANDDAHIHRLSQGSVRDRIRLIFLGVLSRTPSEDELSLMQEEVAVRGDAGYRNIISALMNTREFIFIP